MPLDAFVQAIHAKGRAETDEIIARAQTERQRMLSEIRAEGEKALREAEARAREAADRKRVQELARAELEARKIVLAAQKEALDEVYRRALSRLAAIRENEEFLRTLLKANDAEWRSGGRVFSNARDSAFVKGIVGKAFTGAVECAGGLVIESADGTRRVDLRYESILRDVWDDSVREVAEILWPSRASRT